MTVCKKILLILIFIPLNRITAQEAVTLFKERYSKLSFIIGCHESKQKNLPNANGTNYPTYIFNPSTDLHIGLIYNVFQTGNFNFKTGVVYKNFNPPLELNVTDADAGFTTNNYFKAFHPFDQITFSTPLIAEYYLPLNKNFNLKFGAGVNVNYFFDTNDADDLFILKPDTKQISNSLNISKKDMNISGDFSIGIQFKSSIALFEMYLYHEQNLLSNMISGNYKIGNLVNTPGVTTGQYSINNNFIGYGISITPKKLKTKKQQK